MGSSRGHDGGGVMDNDRAELQREGAQVKVKEVRLDAATRSTCRTCQLTCFHRSAHTA